MAGTFTKELIAKNQRKIAKDFGGVKKFEHDIDLIKKNYRVGTWQAIYKAYSEIGYGDISYEGQYNYLKRTIPNFNKEIYFYKRMDEWGEREMKLDKVNQTYAGMLATAGTRLYDALKEGKNPLTAKKTTVKKTTAKRR